jgi:cyclic pyranopterin phosphate synthase
MVSKCKLTTPKTTMIESDNRSDSNASRISYLRLSVTDKCDMRCFYCTPQSAAVPCQNGSLLDKDVIVRLVRALAINGIDKVRFTGGEPLLREDLIDIISEVSKLPGIKAIGLTTNGRRLAEMAPDLRQAGADCVNISLDSLNQQTFQRITGQDALSSVIQGLQTALECGLKVKTNTVVMRGINDSEITEIAGLARNLPIEVRLIEMMPMCHNSRQWQSLYVPADEIKEKLENIEPIAAEQCASARLYKVNGNTGSIGIISPVSQRFCNVCNRIRVTCCGTIKPCLRLSKEIDLRPLLHQPDLDEEISNLLTKIQSHKLSNNSSAHAVQSEVMSSIGG